MSIGPMTVGAGADTILRPLTASRFSNLLVKMYFHNCVVMPKSPKGRKVHNRVALPYFYRR